MATFDTLLVDLGSYSRIASFESQNAYAAFLQIIKSLLNVQSPYMATICHLLLHTSRKMTIFLDINCDIKSDIFEWIGQLIEP